MPARTASNQTFSRQSVKDYLLNLFRYNDWANRRLIVALPGIADAEPHALVLFSHVIMVEKLWLARIRQTGETLPLWTPCPISELVRQMHDNTRHWLAFIESLAEEDFNRLVSYVNIKGINFENSVRDIAVHTVSHSTHHRGQIVALIRRREQTPPALDYIVFARHEE